MSNIVPIDRPNVPAISQVEYTEAIRVWCKTRDTAEALSREEIGSMSAFARIDAQRKSLVINLSIFYRDNPRADVAPGVLALVTFLSDNDIGACQMSHASMAQILHRTRTSISEAVTRLKSSKLMNSVNGKSLSYPTIPRVVTGGYNHLIWTADAVKSVATCPVEPTGNKVAKAKKLQHPQAKKQQDHSQPVGSTGQVMSQPVGPKCRNLSALRDTISL